MTIVVYLGIAFGAGMLGLLTRRKPSISISIGLLGLVAAVLTSLLIAPGERVEVGDSALVANDFQRLFLVLGSVAALAVTVMALAHGWQRNLPSAMLIGLGALGLGLGLTDPVAGLAATAAAGLPGILVAITTPVDARGVRAAARELRAVAVTGALAVVAAALVSGPGGLVSLSPTIVGLAYLAMAIAVAVRFGAIPFHTRVARVTGAAPGAALPLLLAWAPAGFASAALVWIDRNIASTAMSLDAERSVIIVVGLLCLVLGVLAASIQDDIEHVVGYSVIQDAGFVMLALTILGPGGWEPARTWLLVYVATKSAFAGWAVSMRGAFGTSRIAELSGWIRRAPLLAIALAAIVVATVGLPGLLVWDVRSRIADLSLGTPLALLGLAGGLGSLLYYGRLARVGIGPAGPAALAYAGQRPRGLAAAREAAAAMPPAPAQVPVAPAAAPAGTRGGAGRAGRGETPMPLPLGLDGADVAPADAGAAASTPQAVPARTPAPVPAGEVTPASASARVERMASSFRQDPKELTQRWALEALERAGLSPTTAGPDATPAGTTPAPEPASRTSPRRASAAIPASAEAPEARPGSDGGPEGTPPPGGVGSTRSRGRSSRAAAGRGETAHALWAVNRSFVSSVLAVLLAGVGLAAAAGAFGIADAARAPAPVPGAVVPSFEPEPTGSGEPGIGEPGASPSVSAAPTGSQAPDAGASGEPGPSEAPAESGEPSATP